MARQRTARQAAWAQGGLKIVARASLAHYHRYVRPTLPRCGAKTKSTDDGAPCRNPAMANGRCYVHGGRTGSGSDWHKHRLPPGKSTDWLAKLERKFAQIERDKRRRARRLAKMTPDERQRYDAWLKTHQPGPAAERARRRAERKAAAEMRASMERAEVRPVSPELAELQAERQRIEAERDALLRSIEEEQAIGVFG